MATQTIDLEAKKNGDIIVLNWRASLSVISPCDEERIIVEAF